MLILVGDFFGSSRHLPVERVNFVLSELARVVHPGGMLIAFLPNQASLENLIRLLNGKSILKCLMKCLTRRDIWHIRL